MKRACPLSLETANGEQILLHQDDDGRIGLGVAESRSAPFANLVIDGALAAVLAGWLTVASGVRLDGLPAALTAESASDMHAVGREPEKR